MPGRSNETARRIAMLRDMARIRAFEREAVAATPWHGAPLAYTTDYYTPDELRAAFERYRAERDAFLAERNARGRQ